MLIKKNTWISIFENGQQTQQSCNMDKDRELNVGDVFNWNPFKHSGGCEFKVLSMDNFCLVVEEL